MPFAHDAFCWTRFGTEAGQPIDSIFERKEEERIANGGIFFWGIGNAIGPSMQRLLETVERPVAVFSPIHSRPRPYDIEPPSVVVWTTAQCLDGEPYSLPQSSMITSAWNQASARVAHYALVCRTASPVGRVGQTQKLYFSRLRNLLSGNPVGASQTTAVVKHLHQIDTNGRSYEIGMVADLVWPYFLRLTNPVPLTLERDNNWSSRVAETWRRKVATPPQAELADCRCASGNARPSSSRSFRRP